MSSPPLASELPPGFVLRQGERGLLAVREDLAEALARAGFAPDGGGGTPSRELSGRGEMREIVLADRRLVVRPFRHGGLLRWLTGTRFADARRPFRELALASALADDGLPTPPVVAARAVRAPGFGWHLDLVSERVEDVLDLGQVLERARAGRLPPAERHAATRAVGELVGRLHAGGVFHADLQPRNLLVGARPRPAGATGAAGERPPVWVLDLEGSTRGALDDAGRRRNLARLWRAVRRREDRGRAFLRRTDPVRFLDAYWRATGTGREGRRADLRALEAAGTASLAHRLGWWLERRLGRPERRDGAARVTP